MLQEHCLIWVVGGDRRQVALARALADDGHEVRTFALGPCQGLERETLAGIEDAHCVVLPLPAEEQGQLNAPLAGQYHSIEEIISPLRPGQLVCAGQVGAGLAARAGQRGIVLRDYFGREELAVLNAIPTAEGAVQIALEELPITLHGARVLLLGFGRVGRALAPRLKGLGAKVWVAARSCIQRAHAESMGLESEGMERLAEWLCSYDLVVNTIPAPVLGVEELAAMKQGVLVMDLASRPGGVDRTAAKALGVRVVWALSLPGRVAPVTAGRYIQQTVYHIMEEELGGKV